MSAHRLSELVHRDLAVDPEIRGVTADSRKVKPGYLFAALPGAKADGKAFVHHTHQVAAQLVARGTAQPVPPPELAQRVDAGVAPRVDAR